MIKSDMKYGAVKVWCSKYAVKMHLIFWYLSKDFDNAPLEGRSIMITSLHCNIGSSDQRCCRPHLDFPCGRLCEHGWETRLAGQHLSRVNVDVGAGILPADLGRQLATAALGGALENMLFSRPSPKSQHKTQIRLAAAVNRPWFTICFFQGQVQSPDKSSKLD